MPLLLQRYFFRQLVLAENQSGPDVILVQMEIDESGWRDLNERLDALHVSSDQRDVLVAHLSDRLVGHFGAESVDCVHGKNDPRRHSMREVAAAALAHLAPVLDQIPADALAALVESGEVGSPVPVPWDDHWRTQSRTASWRS